MTETPRHEGGSLWKKLKDFLDTDTAEKKAREESKRRGYVESPVEIIQEILGQTEFSSVPSYWSGMAARRDRCGGEALNRVFTLLSEKVGNFAGDSFAMMALDMPSLAPANVIRASFALAQNNWMYDSDFSNQILEGKSQTRPIDLSGGKDGATYVAENFFGKIAAVTDNREDETPEVKEDFQRLLGDNCDRIMRNRKPVDTSNLPLTT